MDFILPELQGTGGRKRSQGFNEYSDLLTGHPNMNQGSRVRQGARRHPGPDHTEGMSRPRRLLTLLLTLVLAQAQARTYTVVPGDSLSRIAQQTGTTVAALQRNNALRGDLIRVGERLQLPEAGPATYTVLPGDTLSGIAQRVRRTVVALRRDNGLQGDLIYPGQVLTLGQDVPPLKQARSAHDPVTSPWKRTIHTVQAGDTLYDLARTYRTSIQALMVVNRLNTTQLSVGQALRLPAAPDATVQQPSRGLFRPAQLPRAQSRFHRAASEAYLQVGYEAQTWNNCGPAAVASVLRYFGKEVTQQTYQRKLRPSGGYTSAEDIARLLTDLGYEAPVRRRGSLAQIRREVAAGRPVLVLQYHSEVGKVPHWRVVRGFKPGMVVMSDSLSGANVALTDLDFTVLWRGLGHVYIPVGAL